MSHPWLKWYPKDWRADPRLRMCSLAARGIWIELIGYMHEAEPYGHFLINGEAPTVKDIAALVGRPFMEVNKAIVELELRQVFSRLDNGTIYSRRMVRDKAKADQDRANGKGGGNPKLRAEDKGGVNPPDKAQIPEARSQIPEKKETREAALSAEWRLWFDTFWQSWPNKVGKPAAYKALIAAAKRGAELDAIILGVESYVRNKPPDRPWLNPATFLNQNRWEDLPATVGASNAKTGNISSACDNLINILDAGFGGAPPQERPGGGEDEVDARLLAYGRG